MVPLQAQHTVHPLLRLVGPFVVALVAFAVLYGPGRLLDWSLPSHVGRASTMRPSRCSSISLT